MVRCDLRSRRAARVPTGPSRAGELSAPQARRGFPKVGSDRVRRYVDDVVPKKVALRSVSIDRFHNSPVVGLYLHCQS
jgi:hypothetical protein